MRHIATISGWLPMCCDVIDRLLWQWLQKCKLSQTIVVESVHTATQQNVIVSSRELDKKAVLSQR